MRGPEADGRRSRAPPGAGGGHERVRLARDEPLLLRRAELHHAPAFVRIPERGKDLSAHAEVRVTHVRGFDGFGQRERHPAEIGRGHALAGSTITAVP